MTPNLDSMAGGLGPPWFRRVDTSIFSTPGWLYRDTYHIDRCKADVIPFMNPFIDAENCARHVRLDLNSRKVDFDPPHFRERLRERDIIMPQVLATLQKGDINDGPGRDAHGEDRTKLKRHVSGRTIQVVVVDQQQQMHCRNRHAGGNSMTEHYQYTENGLDNVYLVNGFEFVDGRLRIHDIFGLHRAIGRWLVSTRKNLSGGEIRFLRHKLELSQASLSRLLGVTEQTVLRWEKKQNSRNHGNPAAERALRLIYLEKVLGDQRVSAALELIADLEDVLDQLVEFSYSDTNQWHEDVTA